MQADRENERQAARAADSSSTSRRRFLRRSGALAASAIAARILAGRATLAAELPRIDRESPAPFAGLRGQYSLNPEVTYLNHASIGTIPRAVQEAHHRHLALCEENPWLHMWGDAWQGPRESVRAGAARVLGCEPAEVALHHNTTETFNLLASGLPLSSGDEVLMSTLNHTGASACWFHQAERRGFRVRRFEFPVTEARGLGDDDVVALHVREIREQTRVLVFPHVDNTVGLRHPVARLARAARERGVRFVAVDAAQSVGMLPTNVTAMGIDALATSPHKWLQAPKGLGLCYLRRDLQDQLHPMWVTWGQDLDGWRDTARRFEDYGTRNLPAVLALGDALEFQAALGDATRERHHRTLRDHLNTAVESERSLAWRSPQSWEQGGALHAIEVRGRRSRELFERLFRTHGFVFRPFSLAGLELVRISPNVMNDVGELDRLIGALRA